MKRALAIGFWLSLVYAAATGCGLNPKPDLPSGDNASGPTGASSGAGGSAGFFGEGGSGATVAGGGFPEASGGFTNSVGGATTSFPGLDAGAPLRDAGVNDAGPDAERDARPDPLHD